MIFKSYMKTIFNFKFAKNLLFVAIMIGATSFVITSCNTDSSEENNIIEQRSAIIAIEGMMCEKGCKSTIQNKLSEMEGVSSCEINFEAQKAVIKYDSKKLKADDFITKINGIADGIYKATLVEDKDLENTPLQPNDKKGQNNGTSVSEFSFQIPNFYKFFTDLL